MRLRLPPRKKPVLPADDHISATELGLDLDRLPQNDDEASKRFEDWRAEDPFPDAEPALLNTADLFDYIATTGMIHPFEIDESRVDLSLKPASCGIPLGGRFIYWRYDGLGTENRKLVKVDRELASGGELELPANSIVYATLAPTFRLPDYIAARFNLNIKLVYRGLLVGTGPLVDPGFQGRLSIPLHNLTAHACPIPVDEAVLWMEFTKLSANPRWRTHQPQPRGGAYVPFPKRKLIRKDVENYVSRARNGEPIVSSIPALAQNAAEQARRARRYTGIFGLGGAAALAIGLIGLFTFVFDVQDNITNHSDAAITRSNASLARTQRLQVRVKRLEAELRRRLAASTPGADRAP